MVTEFSPSYDGLQLVTPIARDDEYTQLLTELDLVIRAIQNSKIPHVYSRLYIALIDKYPDILTGQLVVNFQPHILREYAGGTSRESVTKFLHDMKAIQAIIEYSVGEYEPRSKNSPGVIRGNPEVIPYPETFRLSETDQRKKERQAQKNRDAQRALILNCQMCGSSDIKYDLLPTCKKCGYKHEAIRNIPVEHLSLSGDPDDYEHLPLPDMPHASATMEDDKEMLPHLAAVDEPTRKVPGVKLPRCQDWRCLAGPNRTELRLSGYYCPVHRGYIDESGMPL